ncbi:MAG: ATP-binding protein [bacterium]
MENENLALIQRDEYLNFIENYIDKPIVKVLVGMRRVGKSAIIKLLINKLLKKNISASNILYINKESLEFDEIKNYKDLYRYAINYFKGIKNRKYIFIDEIQEIAEWEKSVNSFLADNYGDITISGSNSKLLSSELATLLSGRYIEIPVYPLTFKEFLQFRSKKTDTETEFKNFLRYGGLPGIHLLPLKDDTIFAYLNSILNTVLYSDVIIRHKIRDAAVFDRVVKYLFDNIGNITTAKKIADYFKSQKVKVSVDTVLNYITYLETSLIINRVPRYDIKGKKFLEFHDKVFLNDIGLRNGLIGYREKDINGLLENIVYKELQSRGYKVSVGVLNQLEIDFIAEKQNDIKYIQVCYLLNREDTVEREFGSLEKISNNYEKIVVSMDKFFPEERNGIFHKYLIDFLK